MSAFAEYLHAKTEEQVAEAILGMRYETERDYDYGFDEPLLDDEEREDD